MPAELVVRQVVVIMEQTGHTDTFIVRAQTYSENKTLLALFCSIISLFEIGWTDRQRNEQTQS